MFQHLFAPLRLNSVTVRNRIVSTAHNTGLNDGLRIGDRLLAYYEARARGGAGLMIMGSTSVHPSSSSRLRPAFANWDDAVIPEYARLSAVVASHGSAIFAQLNHAGAGAGTPGGVGHLVAPSAIESELSPDMPHELRTEEIAELVDSFATAARRVRAGGMHGLEIHGGHGNLIQQFLSPLTNTRDDEYGGSRDNRMRFALEVIRAVRRAVDDDFAVGLRICAEEDDEGGLHLAEMRGIVPELVAAGSLDYVNVTTGSDLTSLSLARHYASMYVRGQFMRPVARAIKDVVAVPVILTGRITDPRDAEAVLAAGDADLVGMTRALIADRDLPTKAARGELDSIRYCVGANDGCLGRLFRGLSITCIQDPTSGRESELPELSPAGTARHVVVVGGGVAGMEAARTAALRGHRVTLLEKGHELGGQVQLARRAPGREEFGAVADTLRRALDRLGLDIRYGVEADVDTVAALAPDAVVVATGSVAHVPRFENSEDRLVSARGALDGDIVGDFAVVFDTKGDHVGMTTADWLASRGHRVAIVTTKPVLGPKLDPMTRRHLYGRLLDRGVTVLPEHEVIRFTDDGIRIRHLVSGREQILLDAVTVVAACGGRADEAVYKALRRALPRVAVHLVGDALAPRLVEQAIYEGQMAARAI